MKRFFRKVRRLAKSQRDLGKLQDLSDEDGRPGMEHLESERSFHSRLSAGSSKSRRPPRECKGYTATNLPDIIPEDRQVDFFVSKKRGGVLACSLIRCPEDPIRDNDDNSSKKKTCVKASRGMVFELDSSKPVVIICHEYQGWRNQTLITGVAAGVSNLLRCHTLRFDFAGSGHSLGGSCRGNHETELSDLKRIVEFVRECMHCRISCVVSHGLASVAALRFASQQGLTEPISCFVNLAPTCAYTTQQENKAIEEELFSDIRNIKDTAVLSIHGDQDRVTSEENVYKFVNAIPGSELFVMMGTGHLFDGQMKKLVVTISSFIRRRQQFD